MAIERGGGVVVKYYQQKMKTQASVCSVQQKAFFTAEQSLLKKREGERLWTMDNH